MDAVSSLLPGEQVIWSGSPSWRGSLGVFVKSALAISAVMFAGSLLGGHVPYLPAGAGAWAMMGVVLFATAVMIDRFRRSCTRYTLTNRRVHVQIGWISRREESCATSQVQMVDLRQGLLERVLRIGTVDFDTAATELSGSLAFAGVDNPDQLARLGRDLLLAR